MNIKELFEENNEGLLNIFFTAGYPQLDSTIKIAQHLDQAGVKLVEIGMPFSDPLADGTTIQHSSEVALRNGMQLDIMFAQIKEISATTKLTIILMGYLNQMMSIGEERFIKTCKSAGVSGLIIPDLPMKIYEDEYRPLFEENDLSISFLITPRTSLDRIKEADRLSTGFLYLVADNSITGGDADAFSKDQVAYFKRINELGLSTPILIGFGIKNASQYKLTKQYANGAIIGSEFIRQLPTKEHVSRENIARFVGSIVNE